MAIRVTANISRRVGLLSTVAALGIAAPAYAQPVDEDTQETPVQSTIDEDAGQGSEAIVVTGSRIQRRDLTSTSPLAVVQDEEFKLSGAVNVEQVINTLPQVIPGASSFSNNPGGGFATLDLRGLGTTRTLVLVNSRRWMFFDTTQVVDLNTIPQFLIDSVDVVTGGASAVYGSDAIAGVVNFRLKEDLNGVEAGASYAITEEGDGARFNAFMALGTEFADGRGNITVYGEYFKRKSVFQDDREFSTFSLIDGDTDGDGVNDALVEGGSAVVAEGALVFLGGAPGVGNFNGELGAFFQTPGVSVPFDGQTFNYAPANYLMVPQERWLLGGYGSYEISDDITAFLEVAYVNNRVENELAATPIGDTFNLSVDQSCQFLSAQDCADLRQLDANETVFNATDQDPDTPGVQPAVDDPGLVNFLVLRRITETGPRNQSDDRNAFRVLGGIKGPAFENWNYEAYYSYARTRNAQIQNGNISQSAFQAGLDGTGPIALNIFGPGTLTPEMVDSITILSQNNDISTLQVANASLSGTLGNFGWGADDIGLAVGVEYRSMSSQFIPDTALSSGDVIGFNAGDATEGNYNVREVFGELRVPIIADRPGAERLEINGAVRYSDYSLANVGGVWTYAAGAEYAPIRDITFRGQYQRAVRAPNVGELFGGQANGFPTATDPCDADNVTNRTETVRQLCIQTGVPASRVFTENIARNAQIEGLFGGNPDLQEETSDTYTIGAVLRPRFIPRLSITIDGYDITVKDSISVLGGSLGNVLNLCYNVIQDINSVYCQAINRNPASGEIGGDFVVEVLNANIGKFEVRGIDLQVDYDVPLGFALLGEESRLNFFFLGSWLDKFDITPVADLPDQVNECAGRFGILACGQPRPEWKWTSRLSWIDGPMTTSFRWRHLSSVTDDDDDTDFVVEKIGSYDLFDLSFAYDISDEFSMALGVNNLFDKKPDLLGDNQEQANTYPSTYDPLGRDYFVSANFRF